jgi:ligand-binding SRPBCC domain-containing protein
MTIHRFERIQTIPTSLDEAWAFFSNPANLSAITPPSLGFEMRSALPDAMYPGLFITYRVRPFLNLPVEWVTEITHVSPQNYFVDEQRTGPYRIWHHEHHLRELPGGVEMRDLLHYSVGFGLLGDLVSRHVVGPRLESIFAFRQQVLQDRFGTTPLSHNRDAPEVRDGRSLPPERPDHAGAT